MITAPTLVLASELDFWSRPQDRELLQEHLVHAAHVKVVVLRGATRFVHLDRTEHGREIMMEEILSFVRGTGH